MAGGRLRLVKKDLTPRSDLFATAVSNLLGAEADECDIVSGELHKAAAAFFAHTVSHRGCQTDDSFPFIAYCHAEINDNGQVLGPPRAA